MLKAINLCPSVNCTLKKCILQIQWNLKPDAVPTIFNKVDDGQRKRKAEDTLETGSPKTPPLKQKKLDDDSHSIETPPQKSLYSTNRKC